MNDTSEGIQEAIEYLNKRNFVSREEWEAREPKQKTTLRTPISNVVFSYANSVLCATKQRCVQVMNLMQACALSSCELSDVKANFYIGGDGRIYEGRGWKYAPEKYEGVFEKLAPLNRKCIEISFLCRNNTKPTTVQAEAAALVIKEGIRKKILKKDIKVTTLFKEHTIPRAVRILENVKVSRHVTSQNGDPYEGWSVI